MSLVCSSKFFFVLVATSGFLFVFYVISCPSEVTIRLVVRPNSHLGVRGFRRKRVSRIRENGRCLDKIRREMDGKITACFISQNSKVRQKDVDLDWWRPQRVAENGKKSNDMLSHRFWLSRTAQSIVRHLSVQSTETSDFSLFANHETISKILFGSKLIIKACKNVLRFFFFLGTLCYP